MKAFILAIAAAGMLALDPAVVAAQGRGRPNLPPGAADDAPGVTPAEIQRMFDAYALLQAQEQLKIGDDQFTKFLTRFKDLQQVRRQTLNERGRIIDGINRTLEIQFQRMAQMQAELDEVRSTWTKMKRRG